MRGRLVPGAGTLPFGLRGRAAQAQKEEIREVFACGEAVLVVASWMLRFKGSGF